MSSRDNILSAVKQNQPAFIDFPSINVNIEYGKEEYISRLKDRLELLHVDVYEVDSIEVIKNALLSENIGEKRVVTTIKSLGGIATYIDSVSEDAHSLEDIEMAIIPAHFGVVENGAMWITDDLIQYRVLPFIAQQLAVVVKRENILPNMHQAYERIAGTKYEFGVFIAGPSKTADIEQSLVLGAHGPKSMKVFIID